VAGSGDTHPAALRFDAENWPDLSWNNGYPFNNRLSVVAEVMAPQSILGRLDGFWQQGDAF
jgi:hypothetical protein